LPISAHSAGRRLEKDWEGSAAFAHEPSGI